LAERQRRIGCDKTGQDEKPDRQQLDYSKEKKNEKDSGQTINALLRALRSGVEDVEGVDVPVGRLATREVQVAEHTTG
jgi:hypothetical protein